MKLGIPNTCSLIICLATASFGQAPNFVQPSVYPTDGDSASVVAADFNGDGIPDMVTYESASQSLSILFGRPDGTFQPAVSRPLGFAVTSLAAADVNGDRAADLLLTTGGAVGVLLNSGDGSFAPAAFYGAGVAANYVTAADLNRDGAMDLVVAGANGLAVLRGLATGGFAGPVVLPAAFAHY
jgi:hypothetical protein